MNAKAEDAPAEEATRDEVNADTREDEASDPAEIDDDPEEETTKFVEWDPTGRFGRTTELLGRGTYKNVYKAFDEEEGMDVAWNQVKVHGLPAAEKARLLSEVEILKRLDHKNVLKFYHSWNTINEKSGEVSVNFITEACAGLSTSMPLDSKTIWICEPSKAGVDKFYEVLRICTRTSHRLFIVT